MVITYNEMGYIQRCLDALQFADEIVVVDSYSTDGTYEYLKSLEGVRVYQREFVDFTTQKNFALSKTTNDWILFMDSDEFITPRLAIEITNTLKNCPEENAFWFKRQFYYQDRPIRFSGCQTDKNIRLFRKSKASFVKGKKVHEVLEVNGKVGTLNHILPHHCFKSYPSYKAKMIHYGQLKAEELFKKNKSYKPTKHLIKTLWKFTFNYFFRLGILDGKRGLEVCYLKALSVNERFMHLRRLQNAKVATIKPKYAPTSDWVLSK